MLTAIPRALKYAKYLEAGSWRLSAARTLAARLAGGSDRGSACRLAVVIYADVVPRAAPDACLVDKLFEVAHVGTEERESVAVGGPLNLVPQENLWVRDDASRPQLWEDGSGS